MKRLHRFVQRAALILGQKEKTSARVKADLDGLLEDIRSRLASPEVSPEEAKALRKMLSTSEYYGEKLFTCYDHKDMPRTDNSHEHTFGRARGYERRVTGHKSTSRTVRDGPYVIPLIERTLRGGVATPEELARTDPETCRRNLESMRRARQHHARGRLIRENYDTVVERLGSYRAGRRGGARKQDSLLDTAIMRH